MTKSGLDTNHLGSGSGRDCYALAQLVGERGYVLGVDMTDEQLHVANRPLEWHRQRFGYAKSNVEFKKGHIEHLDQLGLEDGSFDLIVSNCVINLSPDKAAVLRQAQRLLKQGGELYFSDVYADRRIPSELVNDSLLYGECLSGALYWNDFLNLAKQTGFTDLRLVEDRPIKLEDPEILAKIGHINFYSATYRLFKLAGLEPACEDYGQAVIYQGGIPGSENQFILDAHHVIERQRVFPVCGNTYRMINETRFKPYFDFQGDWETHFGIFKGCGIDIPFARDKSPRSTLTEGASCGC
jgi:SAM-dependent methyltransferase